MNKDDLILSIDFVTQLDRKDHTTEDGRIFPFFKQINDAIEKIAAQMDMEVEVTHNVVRTIDAGKVKDNAGKCVVCNSWCSAQNRPKILGGLNRGAIYKDKMYCAKHLPRASDIHKKLNSLDYMNEDGTFQEGVFD